MFQTSWIHLQRESCVCSVVCFTCIDVRILVERRVCSGLVDRRVCSGLVDRRVCSGLVERRVCSGLVDKRVSSGLVERRVCSRLPNTLSYPQTRTLSPLHQTAHIYASKTYHTAYTTFFLMMNPRVSKYVVDNKN
jgi:hypothetical protein